MVASLERPSYRLKLVEDGARFYIEVRYRGLTARVKVYKNFQKIYEANHKVEDLLPYRHGLLRNIGVTIFSNSSLASSL